CPWRGQDALLPVRPVRPPLLLPDRDSLLHAINGAKGGLERVAAMCGAHGDHQRGLPDHERPDPVMDRDLVHLAPAVLLADLVRDGLKLAERHLLVRLVQEPLNGAPLVVVTYDPFEDDTCAARGG